MSRPTDAEVLARLCANSPDCNHFLVYRGMKGTVEIDGCHSDEHEVAQARHLLERLCGYREFWMVIVNDGKLEWRDAPKSSGKGLNQQAIKDCQFMLGQKENRNG